MSTGIQLAPQSTSARRSSRRLQLRSVRWHSAWMGGERIHRTLRFRQAGRESQGCLVGGYRLGAASGALESVSQQQKSLIRRAQLDRARIVADRFIHLALLLQHLSETQICVELSGIQPEGPTEALLRLSVLPPPA